MCALATAMCCMQMVSTDVLQMVSVIEVQTAKVDELTLSSVTTLQLKTCIFFMLSSGHAAHCCRFDLFKDGRDCFNQN